MGEHQIDAEHLIAAERNFQTWHNPEEEGGLFRVRFGYIGYHGSRDVAEGYLNEEDARTLAEAILRTLKQKQEGSE